MTTRRHFLTSLAAASGSASLFRRGHSAPSVDATPTVFYAHPAGETTLVRFVVHDADAPAGRLRVYDQSGRRLLGTAGALGVGGSLFGELWLSLRGETDIVSQLEMPGLARPLRTPHRLAPQPRWTLHWVTVVDPHELTQLLENLPVWRRYAALKTLRALKVSGNPFPTENLSPETLDHLVFLREAHPALRLEREFGIPTSSFAVANAQLLKMRASPLALAGVEITRAALLDDEPGSVFHTLRGRDDSLIVAASLPPRSTANQLGFSDGGDVMARKVEQWLTETPALVAPSYGTTTAMVIQTTVDDQLGQIAQSVVEWNSRYAFPHIAIGTPEDFFGEASRMALSGDTTLQASTSHLRRPIPSVAELQRTCRARQAQRASHVEQLLAPLNVVLGSREPGIRGLAEHLDVALDGTLVLNPSPIPRTDLITMPDGSEQLATDIPALGYAYVLGRSSTAPKPYAQLGTHSVFGQLLTVRLNPQTGAISSLYHRPNEREWVRFETPGLNAYKGAVLERVTRLRLPDIGMRLIAERRTDQGLLTTTITAYESLPWIDITNELDGNDGDTVQYDYFFDVDQPHITWETPAGFEESDAPLGPTVHLRWLRLESADKWQILFRGLDAPYTACDATGHLVSLATPGRSRYRLKVASPYTPPDEPWHFGWNTDPFVVVPVAAGGSGRLPRFGGMLTVDQPAIAVLGVKQADNNDGAVVYVQELLGASRDVKLSAGVLGFRGVRLVDALERHLRELPVSSESSVTLSFPAHGVVVVRLIDLFIRGA